MRSSGYLGTSARQKESFADRVSELLLTTGLTSCDYLFGEKIRNSWNVVEGRERELWPLLIGTVSDFWTQLEGRGQPNPRPISQSIDCNLDKCGSTPGYLRMDLAVSIQYSASQCLPGESLLLLKYYRVSSVPVSLQCLARFFKLQKVSTVRYASSLHLLARQNGRS